MSTKWNERVYFPMFSAILWKSVPIFQAAPLVAVQDALPPQTLGRPGKNSPWRDRPKSESLDLKSFRESATNLEALLYEFDIPPPEVLDKMPRVWLCKMKGWEVIL